MWLRVYNNGLTSNIFINVFIFIFIFYFYIRTIDEDKVMSKRFVDFMYIMIINFNNYWHLTMLVPWHLLNFYYLLKKRTELIL